MSLYNFRIQWPVGQGLFHSGELTSSPMAPWNSASLLYVYDCGSMQKYKKNRNIAIDSFRKLSSERMIDFLFISHAHFDHLSGLERLLKTTGPGRVDTIILPLLSHVERLIVYARAVSESPRSATEFYKEMTIDPLSALQRFKPRQIIQMVRGDRPAPSADGGATPGDGPFDAGPDGDPESSRSVKWSLHGRGRVTRLVVENPGHGNDSLTAVFRMDDTIGIRVDSPTGRAWLLSTYVDVKIQTGKKQFLSVLRNLLGISATIFNAMISCTSGLQKLILQNTSKLEAAYKLIKKDVNVTSLCLYSGPTDHQSGDMVGYVQGSTSYGVVYDHLGWLGTGDAELKNYVRRAEFLNFYSSILNRISTLTLPHHGSAYSFHADLMAAIHPSLCVAAADKFRNWQHPGSSVVQSVVSSGSAFCLTTSQLPSELREYALLS
jgi:glyoxylase-like metal-dependent hydrolase (beta-lactamase superfamily II)